MKVTYQFASIWRRILAGLGDYLTMWIISFAVMFLFLINKDISKVFTDSSYPLDGWRFFGYTFVNFGLYFLYFIVIPYLWSGYTFWTRVAKINMIDNENQRLTIKQLCLHNTILWMIMMGWLVIVGIMYWIFQSLNLQQDFLQGLFSFTFDSGVGNGVGFGIGMFAKIVMILIGLIVGVFLINIIVNRSTYALVDSMSDTYMISSKPIEIIEKDLIVETTLNTDKPKKDIPGIFDNQEEIDLLDNPINRRNKEKTDG